MQRRCYNSDQPRWAGSHFRSTGLPVDVVGKSPEGNGAPECYTLAAWGSCEGFQFSPADPPLWHVRARSTSWGTPQKGYEDQAAGPAGGDPVYAPPAPRRNHHHAVFRHFGGHREFNPLVVLFRPFRLAKVFRFWLAFKDWKHGYREPVERLRQDLLVAL